MRFLFVAYNEALDDEVMALLQQSGVQEYTKWTKVQGRGRTSGPHLMSHVWPKANNVLALAVEDRHAQSIMEGVRSLRESFGKEGLKAFELPLQEVT